MQGMLDEINAVVTILARGASPADDYMPAGSDVTASDVFVSGRKQQARVLYLSTVLNCLPQGRFARLPILMAVASVG